MASADVTNSQSQTSKQKVFETAVAKLR